MVKCKHCKHWGLVNAKAEWGYRGCSLIGDHADSDDEGKTDQAVAVDYNDYRAWLETKPDFGCVLGEEIVDLCFSDPTDKVGAFKSVVHVFQDKHVLDNIGFLYMEHGSDVWNCDLMLRNKWPVLNLKADYPDLSTAIQAVRIAADQA